MGDAWMRYHGAMAHASRGKSRELMISARFSRASNEIDQDDLFNYLVNNRPCFSTTALMAHLSNKPISDEMQCVITCIKHFVINQQCEKPIPPEVDFLPDSLNWQKVIGHAKNHRLTSLVYQVLSGPGIDCPSLVTKKLQAIHRHRLKRTLRQLGELRRIVRCLNDHGMDFLLLKGLPLAKTLYGGIQNRSCSDIDLLVQEKDIEKAFSLMLSLGFVTDFAPEHLSKDGLTKKIRLLRWKDISFYTPDKRILIELHWRLSNKNCFTLSTQDLLKHKAWSSFDGFDVPIMQVDTLALYLCYHGAKHGWMRLHWLCDIALLFQRDDIDWNLVISEAKRLGITACLRSACAMTQYLLQTSIPLPLAKAYGQGKKNKRLIQRSFPDIYGETASNLQMNFQSTILQLSLQSNIQAKINVLLSFLYPTDRDRQLLPLPNSLEWLCFFIRPFRIIYRVITKR